MSRMAMAFVGGLPASAKEVHARGAGTKRRSRSVCRRSTAAVRMNGSSNHKAARLAFAFGGGSELGVAFSQVFRGADYEICSVDVFSSPQCDHALCLPPGAPPRAQVSFASGMIRQSFGEGRHFDIMLNSTIGYTVESLASDHLFESVDYMMRANVDSALVTAKLASSFLKDDGLLIMLGSVAAFTPTPSLGYGASKAAIHQIVRSVALSAGRELPADARVIGIVPEVLDTAISRSVNGGVAEANWTPPSVVAQKLLQWAKDRSSAPQNGSLVAVTSQQVQIDEHNSAKQHFFRLINTPSFVQSTLL